ncbi:endonuclease/exonuclease/phosphatase family protein [Shewanella violacea]|uniref:endonuclease/exonuclease/phosphatase family protein n=1 Tax=Shewanella violacea TaxID=60217 RepID=UPI00059CE396|nr:endonuclease/exonuclease/phosphatase family protein [Shewanella violacea]
MKLTSLTRSVFLFILFILISIMLSMALLVTNEPRILTDLDTPSFDTRCVLGVENTGAYLDNKGLLSVSTWNIYKQKKDNWDKQLARLNQGSQLVLLQEAGLSPELSQYIRDTGLKVSMAKAFTLWNTAYGVMNLARIQAKSACAFTETEPLIRFAKSGIVAHYPLSTGEDLLVVNLHGINFEWDLTHFSKQFEAIALELDKHHGPIILAGDLNTWRAERLNFVAALASKHHLSEISYRVDKRRRVFGLPLDHLYYRGLTFQSAESLATDSSDHNPITAHFMVKELP